MLTHDEIIAAMRTAQADAYSPPDALLFARTVERAAYEKAAQACEQIMGGYLFAAAFEPGALDSRRGAERCADAIRSLMEQPK